MIFVGRPVTNSALARWVGKIGLDYSRALFRIEGEAYASERNALVWAAKNPLDAKKMELVYAGNSPLATAESLAASATLAYSVLEDGKPVGPSAPAKAPEEETRPTYAPAISGTLVMKDLALPGPPWRWPRKSQL